MREAILQGIDDNADKVRAAAQLLLDVDDEDSKRPSGSGAPTSSSSSSSSKRALADARFQLLQALSFPRSQLFSKCLRPVVVYHRDLDALLRASYSSVAEEAEAAALAAADSTNPALRPAWRPTPKQVSESVRLIREFDAQRLSFHTWSQFHHEFVLAVRAQKRELLLSRLAHTRLFAGCTSKVEVDERELDRLLCLPLHRSTAPASDAASGQAAAAVTVAPLASIMTVIDAMDAADTRVNSFDELIDHVRAVLLSPSSPVHSPLPSPQQAAAH
jgi:hypothetical protein